MRRVYRTWDQWECYPAGFYETRAPGGMSDADAVAAYADFLKDLPRFGCALYGVLATWRNSCIHYLSNERMNRIAWLGQAAMCYDTGVPSKYRSGYFRLTDEERGAVDNLCLKYLNIWMIRHGEPTLTLATAASKTQMDLY